MKKLLFISMFAILAGSVIFAESKETGGGNGNGGKDKIGGYIGSPFGLSYSHEFNDLVQLDLIAGYSGIWHYRSFDVQIGALFTVFDPVLSDLGNQHCPLSLGPVLGGSINFLKHPYIDSNGYSTTKYYTGASIYLLLPIRWEINFGSIPDFNLFIDVAPIGLAVNFIPVPEYSIYSRNTKTKYVQDWHYTYRLGVGLRYRIPSKK